MVGFPLIKAMCDRVALYPARHGSPQERGTAWFKPGRDGGRGGGCRGRLSTSLSQWADAKTGLVTEAKELIAARPGSAGQC